MKNRVQLSTRIMNSFEKIWPSKKLKEKKRLKSYKSIVKSVLTHNMETLGLTKSQEEELDRAHRKQLRRVVRDHDIKNKAQTLQGAET